MKKIELSDEKKKGLIKEIRSFFHSELDQDIGELKAALVLDFFIENLGIEIYNQGVEDAHDFLQGRLGDLFEIKLYK